MLNEALQVKFSPMNVIHEHEIFLLNDLLNSIDKNENVKEKFDVFFDDVKNHFTFEENLMDEYNFFAKIPHKMEHDRIIKELTAIQNSNLTNQELKEYFEEYFIPWLENHIKTIDTVTAGYFNMVGVATK